MLALLAGHGGSSAVSKIHTSTVGAVPKLRILAESERWCVVGKPAGMMVHHNSFTKKGETVLLQAVRDQLDRRVNAVHRLDGGTSGCVVFAFDAEMTAILQSAMQSPTAQKTYLAHVRGDASLIQDHVVDRSIKDDDGVLRTAQTRFDCLASCEDRLPERSSLMRCVPTTGRWHQIRKHLNGLNHPILGDSSHGDVRVNRWWRHNYDFRHLGLHCHSMHLELPGGESLDVRCPVRPDLIAVWRHLPWWQEACASLPSLRDDAEEARTALLHAAAAEDHLDRVAAAGRGLSVFHRLGSTSAASDKAGGADYHPAIGWPGPTKPSP